MGGRASVVLDGAVVVVTGASSGIGLAVAERLAARGARLVLAGRDPAALETAAAECRTRGGRVLWVETDVADPGDVAVLARRAEEHFGPIDGWVNVAGVMAFGRFDHVPLSDQRRVVEVNLLGAMHGSHEAVVRFLRSGRGVLVNVSSLYGEMTTPFVTSYVASKFGLLGFSRALRRDLWDERGIGVCCVLPSSADTPIFAVAANHGEHRARAIPPVVSPDRVARAVLRCLERPRTVVRVGYLGRVAALGERVAPWVYDRIINPVYRAAVFSDEPNRANSGNLYEPGEHRATGGWRNGRARLVGLASAAAAVGVGLAAVARSR